MLKRERVKAAVAVTLLGGALLIWWPFLRPLTTKLPSWLTPTALAMRNCLATDRGSCQVACRRGVAAGCLGAGDSERACELGLVAGCLSALQFERRDSAATSLARRLRLNDRACSLGNAPACLTFANANAGRDDDRAQGGYDRWCALPGGGAAKPACREENRALLGAVRDGGKACRNGDARACDTLGSLLIVRNADVGLEAFADSCRLRGLDRDDYFPHVDIDCGTGLPPWSVPDNPGFRCADSRARAPWSAHWQQPPAELPAQQPLPAAAPGNAKLRVSRLEPPDAARRSEVERALHERVPLVEDCYRRYLAAGAGGSLASVATVSKAPAVGITVELHLVGDRLGDPALVMLTAWRAHDRHGDLANPSDANTPQLSNCLRATFQAPRLLPANPEATRVVAVIDLLP